MFFLNDAMPDPRNVSDTLIPANVPVIKVATDTVIGHPRKPIYLPLVTFDSEAKRVLRNTNQQYDPGIRYQDEYWTEIVNDQPFGLTDESIERRENYGLWGMSGGLIPDQYATDIMAAPGFGFKPDLDPNAGRSSYEMRGPFMDGMGVVRRVKKPKAAPQTVQGQEAPGVASSTVFAVIGGSILAIGAGIALWAWYSGKKK